MADLDNRVQRARIDARNLWLPATVVAAVFVTFAGVIFGGGMWVERTNSKAATTDTVAADLRAVQTQLATIQGSINVLTGMQQTISDTKSEVQSLKDQMHDIERELLLLKDYTEGRLGSMPYRPPN